MFGRKGSAGMTWVHALLLRELSEKLEKQTRAVEVNPRQGSSAKEGQEGKLLTVRDVASMLGVHEKTLYAWVERQTFPCIRLGKRVRFAESDVSRWLQARREGV